MRWKAVCLWVIAMLFVPAVGFAQGNDLHWGVGGSFTPQWTANESIMKWWIGDVPHDVKGTEFSIGVVRGRMNGGEWGVSFVQKPFKDGGTFTEHEEECQPASGGFPGGCFVFDETSTTRNVYVKGVQYHYFLAVYKNPRFQAGVNIGAGAGWVYGDMDVTQSQTGPGQPPFTDTFTDPAKDVFYPVVALVKVEGQASIVVAPGLKINVAGGLNSPGYGFRIGASYFFGG